MTSTIDVDVRAISGNAAGFGMAERASVICDRPPGRAGGLGLGMNGGELFALAIGGCLWNDLHYAAEALGVATRVERVAVSLTLAGRPPRIVKARGVVRMAARTEAEAARVFDDAVANSTVANSIAATIPVTFDRQSSGVLP